MGISLTSSSTTDRLADQPVAGDAVTTISDALFTSTQQRILALLFGQPERSFYTKELIDLAGAGSGAVQRELRRLLESGLIRRTNWGSQKHYQANEASPIFEELRSIVDKTFGISSILRKALETIAPELLLALLYGSTASGSGTSQSDIDLLLVSDTLTLEQVYRALEPAEKQLGRRVNPTLYSQTEFRRRLKEKKPFLTKLLAGKTVPLIGDRHAFSAT